jgi:hypothetical protein
VTNFPESLALWANVNDADQTAVIDCLERKCDATARNQAKDKEQQYWNAIRKEYDLPRRIDLQSSDTPRNMGRHSSAKSRYALVFRMIQRESIIHSL